MAWTFNDFWTHVDSQTIRPSSCRDYLMVNIVMLLASNHPPAINKIFTLKWWFVSHSTMTRMKVDKRILLWIMDTVYSSKVRGLALMIRFVGSQQEVEFLRLEVFIFFSTLLPALSLAGWCGNWRFLQGWLSFHGQLL